MARVVEAFFLDWCPVPIAQDSPSQVRKPQRIESSNFQDIKWASHSIVKAVAYRQRFDGIYIFKVEFVKDIPVREAIANATIISDRIKTKACKHQHVFHNVHTQVAEDDSLAVLYAHRAVYIEDISSLKFREHLKEIGATLEVGGDELSELLEGVLKDDVALFAVRALDSRGEISTRPALLVLRGFHGDKRDELIASQRIIERDRRMQEGSGLYRSAKAFGVMAFVATFVVFLVSAKLRPNDVLLILSKGVLLSAAVGALAWTVSGAAVRAIKFYMPTRKLLWNGIGYLTVCATYSEITSSIMRRAAQNPHLRIQAESVSDAYKWTTASLMPLLNGDMDKMIADFQIAAVVAAFVAAFGALLALL